MATPTPTERYVWLVHRLGDELGRSRGWQRRVAERLGVSPSYLSHLLADRVQSVGVDVIGKAIDALGLSREAFLDPDEDITQLADWRELRGGAAVQRSLSRHLRAHGKGVDATTAPLERALELAEEIASDAQAGREPSEQRSAELARRVLEIPAVRTAVRVGSKRMPADAEAGTGLAVAVLALLDAFELVLFNRQRNFEEELQDIADSESLASDPPDRF